MQYRTPDGRLWAMPRETFRGDPGAFIVGAEYYGDDDDDDDEEFDEILFAGQPELLGAAKKARKKGRAGKGKLKQLKAMAMARAAGGFAMPGLGEGYGMHLGLPFQATIAAGALANLQLKPQDEFSVNDLVIASPNAQMFDIETFKVGTQDQFVGFEGALNCDILSSQTKRNVDFKGTVATPGILVYLGIRNTDANAQTIKGVVIGPTVRYGSRRAA